MFIGFVLDGVNDTVDTIRACPASVSFKLLSYGIDRYISPIAYIRLVKYKKDSGNFLLPRYNLKPTVNILNM
jgi:hypothetical protein